jgi:outer membrane protein assembly factor BamA
MEHKTLEYDRRRIARSLPATDPDVNLLRLQWRFNELSASVTPLSAPLGSRSLNLSLARSAFGGDANYWELLGDWRNYHPLRKATDTFATRMVFGFRNPDQDPTRIPLDFELGGPETLRGIQSGKLLGERFIQTSFEFRHLLTDRKGMKKALERVGLGSLTDPLRFDRVYSAFFVDIGTAYNGDFQWGRVERSVGLELRAQGLLTAFQPVAIRLGFAHGFGPLGVNDLYLVTTSVF